MHAIAVKLAALQAWYEHVPVVIGSVGGGINRDHAGRLAVINTLEEQQIHGRRATGEDAKIDSAWNKGRPERTALSPCTFRERGGRKGSGHSLSFVQEFFCDRNQAGGLETEFPLEFLERRRSAEGCHSDNAARRANVSLPSESGSLLDGDARGHFRRQHGVAVLLRLMFEDVPGRYRDHA